MDADEGEVVLGEGGCGEGWSMGGARDGRGICGFGGWMGWRLRLRGKVRMDRMLTDAGLYIGGDMRHDMGRRTSVEQRSTNGT